VRAEVGNVQGSVVIDGEIARLNQLGICGCHGGACGIRHCAAAARDRGDNSVRTDPANARVPQVGDVEIARAIYSEAIGMIQQRGSSGPSISRESGDTTPRDRVDYSVWGNLADTIIIRVGNINIARAIRRNPFRLAEHRRDSQPVVADEIAPGYGLNCVRPGG
jgi:hypothetical protein